MHQELVRTIESNMLALMKIVHHISKKEIEDLANSNHAIYSVGSQVQNQIMILQWNWFRFWFPQRY